MDRSHNKLWLVFGILTGIFIPLILAEVYLSHFPLDEVKPFMGKESPLSGIYTPHDGFGISYKSIEDMYDDNHLNDKRVSQMINNSENKRLWLICGTSFADSLYGDAKKIIKGFKVAKLHRHGISLPLYMAQTEMLLKRGLRPEKIFFVILTIEAGALGDQPLDTRYISSKGALLYKPRSAPTGLDWFVRNTTTGLAAWVKSGKASGNLGGFKRKSLNKRVDDKIVADFRRLFENMVKTARTAGIDISVILVPRRRQMRKRAGFVFQDTLRPVFESLGIEVIDLKDDFFAQDDISRLYVLDGHLSKRGNKIIIKRMLASLPEKNKEGVE